MLNIFDQEWEKYNINGDNLRSEVESIRYQHDQQKQSDLLNFIAEISQADLKDQQFELAISAIDHATAMLMEKHKGTELGAIMEKVMSDSQAAYDKSFKAQFKTRGKGETIPDSDIEADWI